MKSGIHPKVYRKVTATCSCGASFIFDSTAEAIKTEICSACHPFYTGKQKLVDTAGKVDKFRAKVKAMENAVTSLKKKGKISENVKAAAAAAAIMRGSAIDSAKVVKKVTTAVQKREIMKAKLEEEVKKGKKEETKSENIEVKNSEAEKE